MTNDKQIDEAKKALEKWAADEVLPPQPSVKRGFIRGYKAALTTAHEQYKPLVEALEEVKDCLRTELNMSNYTHEEVHSLNNESIAAYLIIEQALASIPEELRR